MSFHKANCAPFRSTVLYATHANFWDLQVCATLKELEQMAAIRLIAMNILVEMEGGIFRAWIGNERGCVIARDSYAEVDRKHAFWKPEA